MNLLAEMTRRINATFDLEIEETEATLIDIGCDGQEIEDMIGPGGTWRKQLEAIRDAEILEVRKWQASTSSKR